MRYLEDCGGLGCEDLSGLSMLEILRSTLSFYGTIFAVSFVSFLIGRKTLPKVYFVLADSKEESTDISQGTFGTIDWMWKIFTRVSDEDIYEQCGFDSICFIRMLVFGMKVSMVAVLNGIYLFPVYAKSGGPYAELEAVTLGNVPEGSPRLTAATIACYFVYGFALILLYREVAWYGTYRHKYISKPRVENYSIYLKHIPGDMRTNKDLEAFFRNMLGRKDEVINAQVVLQTQKLDKLNAKRDMLCGTDEKVGKFEHAINLLHTNRKGKRPRHRTVGCCGVGCAKPVDSIERYSRNLDELNQQIADIIDQINSSPSGNPRGDKKELLRNEDDFGASTRERSVPGRPMQLRRNLIDLEEGGQGRATEAILESDDESLHSEVSGSSMRFGVEAIRARQGREVIRQPEHGQISSQMDLGLGSSTRFGTTEQVINEYREVAVLDEPIEHQEVGHGSTIPRDAAFIMFSSLASKLVAENMAYHPTPYILQVESAPRPEHVIWQNVGISHVRVQIGQWTSVFLTTTLCLAWTIIVAFVASLGEVESLVEMLPFLKGALEAAPWLSMLLSQIKPLLLAILVSLLVPILTSFSRKEGHIGITTLAASVYKKLAIFLVIQMFIVNMLAGTVLSSLQEIAEDPASIITLLAEAIPEQAVSFSQYLIVQTTLDVGGELLRAGDIAKSFAHGILVRMRPWIDLERRSLPPEMNFPEVEGKLMLYSMILFAYSVMAPVVSVIAGICLFLILLCYRHQFIYVYSRRNDTGGLLFAKFVPLAIGCILVSEITLLAVLMLKQSIAAVVLLIPLIVGTFMFQAYVGQQHYRVAMQLPMVAAIEKDEMNKEEIGTISFARDEYMQPSRRERYKEPRNMNLI